MTNTTKNKKTAQEPRSAQAPPAENTGKRLTIEELLEKNAELERRLRKYKEKQKNSRTSIKAIIRPKGEAGNRKRGFILYDAMEMNKLENGPVLYDRMRDSVRKACVKVGLDFGAHYKNQDHEKLGQVFHLVRRSNPYLATERFPHNWAIADMVKGYIAGTRKEHLRQAREEEEERQRQTATKRSKKGAGDSDNDEGENDIPLPSSNTKIRKTRSLPEPDLEENDGQQSIQSTKTRKSRRCPQPEQEEEGSSASTSTKTRQKSMKDSPPEGSRITRKRPRPLPTDNDGSLEETAPKKRRASGTSTRETHSDHDSDRARSAKERRNEDEGPQINMDVDERGDEDEDERGDEDEDNEDEDNEGEDNEGEDNEEEVEQGYEWDVYGYYD